MTAPMQIRKRADKTVAPTVTTSLIVDPDSGEKFEVEEATYPFASAELIGEAPSEWLPSGTIIGRYLADGFVTFEGLRVSVTEAGGKPYGRNPVLTGDVLVLDLTTGKLRYRVLECPGRYQDPDGSVRVTHAYRLELIEGKGK